MHVHHIRAQPLAGDLEREQRAGGVLEEGVDDGEPGQPIIALLRLAVQLHPLLGLVEQEQDLVRGKAGNAEQPAMRKSGGAGWVAARGC